MAHDTESMKQYQPSSTNISYPASYIPNKPLHNITTDANTPPFYMLVGPQLDNQNLTHANTLQKIMKIRLFLLCKTFIIIHKNIENI